MKVKLSKVEKEEIREIIKSRIADNEVITKVMWSCFDTSQFDKLGYFYIEFYCKNYAYKMGEKICWNGVREDGRNGCDWIYIR